MTELQTKRALRRKETAEDFTPRVLVDEMLDKLPAEVWTENKTFCDPASGDGNFLMVILERKLSFGHDHLSALSTIYGVELMKDNVVEMKSRLLTLIPEDLHKEAKKILNKNIKCHDALTWDFSKWKSSIVNNKRLF